MAAASDELLDFLLSGIAICGLGGATSADFRRIINEYYHKKRQKSTSEHGLTVDDAPIDLGRSFYEQVWQWVTNHQDVRVYYKREARSLSLFEFEELERKEGADVSTASVGGSDRLSGSSTAEEPVAADLTRPSTKLTSLGNALRQRLLGEGHRSAGQPEPHSEGTSILGDVAISAPPLKPRDSRQIPKNVQVSQPAFDEPDAAIQGPRLCTSQNQTWIAITGHPIDLIKVPGSEFVLLAIIATSGPGGISQPELQKLSGQDKRSVPARTDSLYKKGYIDKRPIQWGKARTSLCTHYMYLKVVQEDPKSANDVFGDRTLSLTGLLFLLNKTLETTSVVQVRHLRKKMGVTVERWNGRAVRGALIRLEQTGYLRRFSVEKRRKDPRLKSNHFICIQRLRDPIEDDIKNLKFKRMAGASASDAVEEVPPEDENAGDGSMQELEQDLMNDGSDEDEDGDADRRIPPQWTPDRLLTNLVVDAVDTAGIDGTDAAKLRDITTGFFWKRPIESLVTRLTDGWDKNQPPHVRHLAIVRDTAMANDKKRVHYLYRTHQNFQKAVDAGEVTWEALELEENKKGARSKKQQTPAAASSVDKWGFRQINRNDFHQRTGSSSLSESRAAIERNRRAPRDWEAIILAGESPRKASSMSHPEEAGPISKSPAGYSGSVHKSKVIPRPLLTQAERLALSLPARGRLGGDYESQIRAHRKKTGDPSSIPNKFFKGVYADEEKEKPRYERRPGLPLLTREQRKARGLPEHGRLSFKVTEQILKEQGRNESLTHMKSSANVKDTSTLVYGERIHDGEEELEIGQQTGISSGIGNVEEQVDSTADEDVTMLDDLGSRNGVSPASQQPLNDISVEAPATPQSLDSIAQGSPPRSQLKRPYTEVRKKRGRPKKRIQKSTDDPRTQAPSIEDHPTELDNDSLINEPVATGLVEDPVPELAASEASLQTATTPSQTPKALAKGRRGLHKKAVEPKPEVPLTEAELHVQAVKAQYDDRVEPGVYVNPYATKPGKGGRGRPRKMFIATFKLPGLHKLDWFIPEVGYPGHSSTLSITPAKSPAEERSSRFAEDVTAAPSPSCPATDVLPDLGSTPSAQFQPAATEREPSIPGAVSLPSIQPTEPQVDTADAIDSQETVPTPLSAPVPIGGGTSVEVDEPSGAVHASSEIASELPWPTKISLRADELHPGVLDVAEALRRSASLARSRAPNDRVTPDAVEHASQSEQSVSEVHEAAVSPQDTASAQLSSGARRDSSRLPPAMDNANLVRTAPYQTPHGLAPFDEPPRLQTSNADHEAVSVVDNIPHETASRDSPFVVEEAVSVEPSQKKEVKIGRGVILGKGSVAHARSRIIRHILDLCGGVFPGTEVMYPIFTSVWEELGPKSVACPIPGTVRRAIIDLCHPHSDLREMKFKVPRNDLPGNKTRSVFFYKHLEFNSPEVQSVVKGVIQAYPEKYCPPGVKRYWKEEVKPVTVMPKIDNSYFEELYAPTSRRLDERIKEARKERRRLAKEALQRQRELEKAAKKEAKRVAKDQKREERLEHSGSRRKLFKERQRLGGLHDGSQIGIGNQYVPPKMTEPSQLPQQSLETVPVPESSDEEPLVNTRPRLQNAIEEPTHTTTSHQDGQSSTQEPLYFASSDHAAALMSPAIGYHSTTHTFSTGLIVGAPPELESFKKSRKRVRIEQPADQTPRKKPRKSRSTNNSRAKQSGNDFLARHHIEIQESSDEDDDDEQDEIDVETSPTLAQRLAGLTGDLNQPDYEPAKRKRRPPVWSEPRDRRRRDRTRRKYIAVKGRTYPETFDPQGEFRKLCYTLIIASSMAGEDGNVDWNIVKKVYIESPRFDLEKTKKRWAWMQKKMAPQLQGMTGSFQSQFLSAYEEGKVDMIEDPSTYDWGKLVRWAVLTCTCLEPPLPLGREALGDYQFDLSSYDILDRKVWYNTTLANINRDERFIRYTFGSPLHGKRKLTTPGDEDDLKARSLIRANISTPKELYDKELAHEELRKLPEPVIGRSVNDLLQANLIKQRKIKRLLPGRNYHFSPSFAKHYRRTFELSDFMTAVQLKKDLDAAFTNADLNKRTYFVSRAAENGTVMALISLASESKIKLVPQLPPINNDFDAPIPRISVWGFSEGDYQHRHMDRKRLFWPLAVEPTDHYEYGNPLRPTLPPPAPTEETSIAWDPMPEPPLPARDQDLITLLPVWSTIDGRTAIYPWWNRILNIVVQALLFQPSITAQEIFARCETYTTELFEIQLVLDWLITVNAAKRSPHGTHELLPGYWAVFGDKLIDEENDEFGEHVRRYKTNRKLVPTWRTEYNNEYNLRSQQSSNAAKITPTAGNEASAGEQILGNVRKQYTIVKHALQNQNSADALSVGEAPSGEAVTASRPAQAPQEQVVITTPTPAATPSTTTQDVEMTDADAEGESDVDAEGESDDEYL
ncbi:uncharacterized protein N0V89_004750 [Didymosphaeria variabile]|uniref:Uncharacterized protein n=1 Tax=Didymosphaeria variabile TaxID=1932322 RepID=A0A9W8XQU9_9PLEO|nr:uncharacterized protein N0V89_004750 [Didymosphaeria variabile]KAJ4356714.1 hypothetical protein N0V89_004750 [Didymosphaeria variabile]